MYSRVTSKSIRTLAVLALVGVLTAACSSASGSTPEQAASTQTSSSSSETAVQTEQSSGSESAAPSSVNLGLDQDRVTEAKVDSIAAELPQEIRDRGTLRVTGSAGSAPPLRFYASDDTTIIGSEVDLAYLFADVLGLKVEISAADWAQNFVQIDSGRADVFISNVTVTEERKEKYDFATYRLDNLAFEVKKGSGIKIAEPKDIAGLTVAVGSGTNQEKILLDWNDANVKAGLAPADIKYFQNATDYYLALDSGRIDAYFGPNPSGAYHAAVTGDTEIAGTFSGAGFDLQGKIAVLSKKGNGLAQAFVDAINHTIEDGSYAKVLAKWGISNEAVEKSELNPPGLPKS